MPHAPTLYTCTYMQDSEAVKAEKIAQSLKGSNKMAVYPIRFHGLFTDGERV